MADQSQIPEISEISINDIFDIYSTGNTFITKSLGYGSLGPVFQATQKCDDASKNIVIKSFSCSKTLYEQIANQVNNTDVFQNSQNVLQFQLKKVAENGDHVATAFEMELCQKSLQQKIAEIKEGKVNPTRPEVLVYYIQALNGLLELQEKGYEHHNLKSSNILISEDDTIKISDSSFTLELSQKIYNKPQQYNRFLSINYLSPEYTSIIDGKTGVDINISSDVFSLGVIFLELIGQEVNIVSSIKLKSGIFDGVQVREGFQDLANFVCENMLCFIPADRKTISWLIEALSEKFFNEVTKFSLQEVQNSNVEQPASQEKEVPVEAIETAAKEAILVEQNDEAKDENEGESQEEEIGTPLKNSSFNENEYEILENNQEGEIQNTHQASAKKQDENADESQESTLDQEAIQAQNQNQESETNIQENSVSSSQAIEQINQVDNKSAESNQEKQEIPLVNLDDEGVKKQITRIQRLRIDLSSKDLTTQQVVALFQRLEAFTSLTHLTLDLSNNSLEDDSVSKLSQYLQKCQKLTDLTLNLQGNKFTPLSLTVLNNALCRLVKVTRFSLSIGSQFLSESLEKTWEIETISLVNVVKSWRNLSGFNLSLGQIKVSDMFVNSFVTYLTEYTALKELSLEFGFSAEVTEESWNNFVQFVQGKENLTKTSLPVYEIKQEPVVNIAEEVTQVVVEEAQTTQLVDQVEQSEETLLNEKKEDEQVEQQNTETEVENTQQEQQEVEEDTQKEVPVTQQEQLEEESTNQEIVQETQEKLSEQDDLKAQDQGLQVEEPQEEQVNDAQEVQVAEQADLEDNQSEEPKQETLVQNEVHEEENLQESVQNTEENNVVEEKQQEQSESQTSE